MRPTTASFVIIATTYNVAVILTIFLLLHVNFQTGIGVRHVFMGVTAMYNIPQHWEGGRIANQIL